MAYNDEILRTDGAALIPEEVTKEIFNGMVGKSAVLTLATRLPNMVRGQERMPVLNSLPTAYFRNPTDVGVAQTTKQAWVNKYINAEELVVLVPIPKNVLEDSAYDIWTEVQPRATESIGKAIDQAVFKGLNAPSSWPTNIRDACAAAGQSLSLANFRDLYDALLSDGGTCDQVEQDGFVVGGHYAVPGMKARLRGVRDADGGPIFHTNPQQAASYLLDGNPIFFAENGAATAADFLMICGDWKQMVYSVRREIEYTRLDQAVITDNTGAVVYNLPQQGMVAMMLTLRLGWQVPNPPSQINPNAATRYPFAVLTA